MSKIHACPALDRLVAEKVMGVHLGWYEEDDPPAYSSDPGEALTLLHEVNLKRTAEDLLPLSLHSCLLTRRGLGYICCTLILGMISEAQTFATPAIAITVGVLLAHGMPLEDIGKACAGEEACHGED